MTQFSHPPGLATLTKLVRDCSISGVARRVLLLRTDLLPPRLSRPQHLRLAEDALEPLTGADRACRYDLSHARIAISWRGEDPGRLRQALEALEHLLLDAPLDAPALPEFVRLFDLPRDGAALLALAGSLSPAEQREHDQALATSAPPPLPRLAAADVERIESVLAHASVARFARRRLVARMGVSAFSLAWEWRHLSMPELMAELAPGRNARVEPWQHRRLKRVLERRMLALLSTPSELRHAGPFSLDLSVEGTLSPEFLRFDAALPPALRGHAVISLRADDVMADLPAYRFARAFTRTRGYRILLRGLTPDLLPLLELSALDLDFAELAWATALVGLDPGALRAGTTRWVLSRADEPAALQWGQSVGIGLFQGDAVTLGPVKPQSRAA